MYRSVALLTLSLWLTGYSLLAKAEQFQAFDTFEVHYNAFNSTFLTPDVAQNYGISRSKVRGLLNVAVLDAAQQNRPTSALVTGQVVNLVGQAQSLTFKQIREGEAVYYIGEFRFTNDELLHFNLQVQPDPNKPAYSLKFNQHFYVD